jgi:hypothetical protein
MTQGSFDWKCQPKAEAFISKVIDDCCQANSFIDHLGKELFIKTSTRIFDWVDHVVISHHEGLEEELESCGFEAQDATQSYRVFHHPGAQLPRILVNDHGAGAGGIALKVDSIADFLMVRGISGSIEGSPYSRFRRCCVNTEEGVSLYVVERRGSLTMEPVDEEPGHVEKLLLGMETWQTRSRRMKTDDEAFKHTLLLAEDLVGLLGKDFAAWTALAGERKYWQSRNSAGQIQKNRQDHLGMGWANHDHHTFRSSRKYFQNLVRLFEILGFHCRERFYAGEEAGWGAQVMENTNGGFVLFLDVDLDPEEVQIDFSHHHLSDLEKLGTIGLWCELHGDSILTAGMHHLESQFMFDELTADLEHYGIGMMAPFSDFDHLKQAFTAGEVWAVDPKRIERLLSQGKISRDEADKFIAYGAIGSHLENLQRREGFKGFNQQNVSMIIKKTDPRTIEELHTHS